MALALDEAKNTDTVFEVGGHKYIADNEFLKAATPVMIDFNEMGFKVTSSLDLSAMGGGCSGCSSSGGCGTD